MITRDQLPFRAVVRVLVRDERSLQLAKVPSFVEVNDISVLEVLVILLSDFSKFMESGSLAMLPAYAQRKGTLAPGQTISVNNFTVQVERYLSQGGFAHVYLVRTPAPVYNTTHHVLKRIAVANEAMLTEVKKEVDVMRLLKGHPNIVHFIDASWHKLPNGSFEVFILMEYCPGGGIIDMMNRRLRERLTEAEILQIFVDVCEGVAYMHNSRPAVLHRDLKVENILQSSPTSFKLCDFGSATTISGPPSNMQEIRALEADLNKHTTLQYRAPEMVDVYSKRPINEKSDVWALGVLLYKLCYYTTPFEEHGPLAILNVQYRTPPYPSYSQDMHMLIASMLREHGSQRPTVFELLAQVHRLRGTKSKFSYTIPVTYPLLPRVSQTVTPLIPNHSSGGLVPHGVSTKKPALSMYSPGIDAPPAVSNQGIQAREKVLEAIAPMRRGRPSNLKEGPSRQPSPHKSQQTVGSNWLDSGLANGENQAWKTAKDKTKTPPKDDDWLVVSPQIPKADISRSPGFGDDFAEKLWSTSDPNATSIRASPQLTSTTTNTSNETSIIPTPLAFTGSRMLRPKQDRIIPNRDKAKDAFDGLGLMSPFVKPAPTLGEARKLRTGLAVMSNPLPPQGDHLRTSTDKPATISPRPTPSPHQTYLSPMPNHLPPVTPASSHGNFNSSAGSVPSRLANTPGQHPSGITDGLPVQSKFPSLEELDAQVSSANSFYSFVINDNSKRFTSQFKPTDVRPFQMKTKITNKVGSSDTGEHNSKMNVFSNATYNLRGVMTEQASKDNTEKKRQDNNTSAGAKSVQSSHLASLTYQRRPSLIRRHRSSVSMKPTALLSSTTDKMEETSLEDTPKISSHALSETSSRDWLTGDDHEDFSKSSRAVPVLRESPSKRASFIAQSDLRILEGSSAQHVSVLTQQDPLSKDLSPTVSKFKRAFPDVEKIDVGDGDVSSTLTDAWSPARTEADLDSSSSDEGPEDVGAVRPMSRAKQKKKHPRLEAKERQSSVHDLVNQYGGGLLPKERENESELSIPQTNDAVPRKSQATGLAPPVKQESERKTPSPNSSVSPMALVSPGIAYKPSHRPQVSISTQRPPAPPLSTKPSSSPGSRTRPQSMFIFPSTSNPSNPPLEATNLMPPEEPHPRPPRRLSISDMVQKYEAISGKGVPSLPPGPPSPVKPLSSKVVQGPANGQKAVGDSEKVTTHQASPVGEESSGNQSTRPTTAMNNSSKQFINNGELLSKPLGRKVSDSRKSTLETISSPRKLSVSVKAASKIVTSSNRTDPLATARATKSSAPRRGSPDAPQISRSPRKRTMSIPSNTTSKTKDESRSPAENETYQGVSKLIDQWQKKSAEAGQSRPLPDKKRSFPTKRVD